jgi:hypothetical protein
MSSNQGIRSEMHLRLRKQGLTVEGWARTKNINDGIASKIVSRYVGQERRPRGWRSKEIIEGLEKLTGLKLCG